MSSATLETARRARAPWHTSLTDSIRRRIAAIRDERRIRRGIAELGALDDRMLADIGLSRGDIAWAARYGRFEPDGNDGHGR